MKSSLSGPPGQPGPGEPAPSKPLIGATPRDTAIRMLAAGLWPIPIYPPGVKRGDRTTTGKEPYGTGWGLSRNTLDSLAAFYKKHPKGGVGIALGPGRGPGGAWLIDVEGDGPEAEASRLRLFGAEVIESLGWRSARGAHQALLADSDRVGELLKPLGHLEGKTPETKGSYKLPAFPGLEIRFGGVKPDGTVKQVQSVFPPTPGTDGKPREWNGVTEIAAAPETLYQALADAATTTPAVAAVDPSPKRAEAKGGAKGTAKGGGPSPEERALKYLAKCEPAVSGSGGHNTTFKVAVNVGPGFDLNPDVAFRLLWGDFNPRCQPPWSEGELRHKVTEAYKAETRRGWLLNAERDGGERAKPSTNGKAEGNGRHHEGNGKAEGEFRPNEAVGDPHRLARKYLREFCSHTDGHTLRYWQGEFHRWEHAYRPVLDAEIKAEVTGIIKTEFDRANRREVQQWEKGDRTDPRPTVRPVTRRLVADVVQALSGYVRTDGRLRQPCWLDGGESRPSPERLLPTSNALVDLSALVGNRKGATIDPTPHYFCPYALDYPFDPSAKPPGRWLEFLRALWPNDPSSIEALQEWFGYLLTPDTSHQKILMLIGPRRSGKGTIARVIKGLIGSENVANPTLSGLATNFGLAPLVGRPAAIITDARVSGRTDIAQVVERLLTISGEDSQTVDRKHQSAVTVKLPTRFTLISNELPRLADSSGALTGRLILLRLTESFYGREDRQLTDALLGELPGILLWSIEGWRRLRERGRFVQPDSGRAMVEEMEDLASPIGAFVKEACRMEAGAEVEVKELFSAWKRWCEDRGRDNVGDQMRFGRDLRAVWPHLESVQHRQPDGSRERCYKGIRLVRLPEGLL